VHLAGELLFLFSFLPTLIKFLIRLTYVPFLTRRKYPGTDRYVNRLF
jgi:hypothetical protein